MMRKASLWAACVGLMWSATSSAVPVYYTYGYFGDGRSYENGDDPTFRFTMEYDVDQQATYLNGSGVLVTQQDQGLHTNPSDPWFGHYQLDYFHARLAGTSEELASDLSLPNESTSFRQFLGPDPTQPFYEDVVRWESGDYFIQLVRTSIIDAPIGHAFSFIADIGLGQNMICLGTCGENLRLVGVSSTNNIPEPGTVGLLVVGAAVAFGAKRRRSATKSARA
ncbi:PEP-CTERM sorting domain-containing protein [Steroidobacter flavus]|uniref:PEP-CTERM sorting domain-containing protein n=1 Tax=Steroidobacter flavus TaxID=1842136 RepID=A0ABV8SVI0_9GAMM